MEDDKRAFGDPTAPQSSYPPYAAGSSSSMPAGMPAPPPYQPSPVYAAQPPVTSGYPPQAYPPQQYPPQSYPPQQQEVPQPGPYGYPPQSQPQYGTPTQGQPLPDYRPPQAQAGYPGAYYNAQPAPIIQTYHQQPAGYGGHGGHHHGSSNNGMLQGCLGALCCCFMLDCLFD